MALTDAEKPKHETVMDVTEEQIARVYAQAFLAIASKTPDCAGLVEEVNSLVTDVLDRFPNLAQTLHSALIPHDEKMRMLDRVFGGRISTEVMNFLKVLSKHGRLVLIRSAARQIKKLYAEQQGQMDVEVRVAKAIDERLQGEIRSKLASSLGKEPLMHVVVDPSLIAGMVIRVGDRVYDGSVGTQFNLARKAMIEKATDLIETDSKRFLQTAT
jgi:F-type H+-transporting ATPase subunit delta